MRRQALQALSVSDPKEKICAVRGIACHAEVDAAAELAASGPIPGRPSSPQLVAPNQVKSRSAHTAEGRAALIHSLAHIEFNAINLALDIIWRFPAMPAQFYRDWLSVAHEEAYHFELLVKHLATLGHSYGDFPAHDGLWEMAERTNADLLARLALVPRTLEARGLDASPVVRNKLASVGDHDAAAIIDIILRDEIGHVAIGNHWYRYLCDMQGLDPLQTYKKLAEKYRAPRLRGPFNFDARRLAGFTEDELNQLAQQT